jgi:hypothetical protein
MHSLDIIKRRNAEAVKAACPTPRLIHYHGPVVRLQGRYGKVLGVSRDGWLCVDFDGQGLTPIAPCNVTEV